MVRTFSIGVSTPMSHPPGYDESTPFPALVDALLCVSGGGAFSGLPMSSVSEGSTFPIRQIESPIASLTSATSAA